METEHEQYRRDGFFFDVASVRLDLYRLITCFYASVTFAEKGEDIDEDVVRDLQNEFEEFEITRLLVNIASTARIIDNREGFISGKFNAICGELIQDINKPDTKIQLSLREACNKIIHAKKFKWDVDCLKDEGNLPYPTTEYITPRIYLYGSMGDKEWKASLSIVEFVRCIIQIYAIQNY